MSLKERIENEKLPLHVAIIMDGNGRWARQKGMDRIFGHQQGVNAVREVIECAAELGIKYLTLYAFSTENWERSDEEVSALMRIMVKSLNEETDTLINNNIRLKAIGDVDRLADDVKKRLIETINLTSNATGLNLIIAMSYSSRWEICEAIRKLSADVYNRRLNPDSISEDTFEKYLTTYGVPDPDLMIRTSGELRISNFLLWQIAYAELYFTEILWPDFGKDEFCNAIIEYQKRERRFGRTGE